MPSRREIELIIKARDQASSVFASVLAQAKALQGVQLSPFGRLVETAQRTDALAMEEAHGRALQDNAAWEARATAERLRGVDAAQAEAVSVNRLWDAEHRLGTAMARTTRGAQDSIPIKLSLRSAYADLAGVAVPLTMILGTVGAAFRGVAEAAEQSGKLFEKDLPAMERFGRGVGVVAVGVKTVLESLPIVGGLLIRPITESVEKMGGLLERLSGVADAGRRAAEAFADLDEAIQRGQQGRASAAADLGRMADEAERGARAVGRGGLEQEEGEARRHYRTQRAAIEEGEKKYWGQTPRMPGVYSPAGARAAVAAEEELAQKLADIDIRRDEQRREEENEGFRQDVQWRVQQMQEAGQAEIAATLKGAAARRAQLELEIAAEKEMNQIRYRDPVQQERIFGLRRKALEDEIAAEEARERERGDAQAASQQRRLERGGLRGRERVEPPGPDEGVLRRGFAALEARFLTTAPPETYPVWARQANAQGQQQVALLKDIAGGVRELALMNWGLAVAEII